MRGKRTPIRSELGWSTPDRVVVRGKDLPGEILGHFNLGDMAFLELTGRAPNAKESKVFNAMVVTLVEHGVTPSALVARLTYLGAPEAMQAAVAAGLCGLGSVFVGSTEGCAKMLTEGLSKEKDLQSLARKIVKTVKPVPGIGHNLHKPIDPRAERLFEIGKECGFYGNYCKLIREISKEAEHFSGKSLPVNATGAIAALACELGLDWRICRGLGVMARAVGLVGHLLEESRQPMAAEVWYRTEDEASGHLKPKS